MICTPNHIAQKVEEEISSLPEHFIVLFVVSAKMYHQLNEALLKVLLSTEHLKGIYITVNKPYSAIKPSLEAKGINTNNLFFIDAITQRVSGIAMRTEGVLFMASPQSLTDLGIAIDEALSSFGEGQKFVLLDSLSTLQIYNSSGTVANFLHFLTAKLRISGVKGVFITLQAGTDQRLIDLLVQFGDKVIYIDSET